MTNVDSQGSIVKMIDAIPVTLLIITLVVQAVESGLELHPMTAAPTRQTLLLHALQQTQQLAYEQTDG